MMTSAFARRILRGLLRSIYRRVLPSAVRDALRLQRELAQREVEPVVADPPASSRILVLAPHMDDEVFGCGATIARAAAAGCEVRVVFITDGSKGYDPARVAALGAEKHEAFEQALIETRKAEAKRAAAILGYADPIFLDLPDGSAGITNGAAARLASVIREVSPDVVFLPFLTDPHPDHWATNRMFIDASMAARLAPSTLCWGYEVWTPLVANTFVDVTAAMERKRNAMACFKSQNSDVDYPRAIEALNAYRSLAAGVAQGYVEAFFVETLAEYGDLFRKTWPDSARRG